MSLMKLTIGTSRAGSLGNAVGTSDILATWQAALDAGIRSFDTANIYAQGDSERLLGRLLVANPATQIQIITKAGIRHGHSAQAVRWLKPVLRPLLRLTGASGAADYARARIDRANFDPGWLSERLDESLRRMGIATVAGFLLHDPAPDILSRPSIGGFLRAVKASGRAQLVGVSLADKNGWAAALGIEGLDILQMSVSDYESLRRRDVLDLIRQRGIRLYLRQILNRPLAERRALEDCLPELLADPAVHSVIVGISQRRNLDTLLSLVN